MNLCPRCGSELQPLSLSDDLSCPTCIAPAEPEPLFKFKMAGTGIVTPPQPEQEKEVG